MKGLAARCENPHPGTLRQERRGDQNCPFQDVLARVENEQRAGIAQSRRGTSELVRAANVDRAREQPHRVLHARCTREVDEPDAVLELMLECAGGLDREPALAHARRPGERYEALLVQNAGELAQLVCATDERRRWRGEVAAAPALDGNGDRRIVREDRLLDAPQLWPRFEPELLGEHPPRLLKGLESIRLATAAIERQHQLRPQPFPERVVRERRAQRRHELPMLSQRERRLELLLERVDAQRLEPLCLGAEPGRDGQALKRRPAPEGQRRGGRLRRAGGVAAAQRCARIRQQLLEPNRIDARVRQGVSIRGADDRLLSERGAKTGDVVMERIPWSGRELLSPQAVDERVDVDHLAAPERQHREQRLSLGAAHVRARAPGEDLERAQDPDLK